MEGKKSIKEVIDSIRFDSKIDEELLKDVISGVKYRAPFMLLVQIYNSTIAHKTSDKNKRKQLLFSLLQQMSLAIAGLTSFSKPRKLLALFQKEEFYDYSTQTRGEFTCLTNKIYGLFPQIKNRGYIPKFMQFQKNKCIDHQYIGNPNWLLTRTMTKKWLQANERHLSKDITFIASLLISSQKLIKHVQQDSKDDLHKHWNKLWVYLYLWLNRQYLNYHLDQNRSSQISWYNGQEYQILNYIKQLKQAIRSNQDKFIYNLVLFLIEEYIIGENDSNKFMDAIQAYKMIDSAQNMTSDHLMMIYLIKKVADRLKHQKICDKFNKIINDIADQIKPAKQQADLSYILLHIIPQQKIKRFIQVNKLPFWQYELDTEVNESISKQYLQTLYTFDQDQKLNILLNLNNTYFIQHIFKRILEIPQKKNSRDILRVIDRQNERISQKIKKVINGHNISNDIKAFVTQWQYFYRIQLEGVTQQNFLIVQKFLTFDMQNISKQFKYNSYCPQQINESMVKIINKLISSHQNNKINKEYIYSILDNPTFASHLANLDQKDEDSIWSKIAELFLQNDDIFDDLISIKPLGEDQSSQKISGDRSASQGF